MHQDLQTVKKLSQSYHLKKAFKFLLSLSIFSLFLSYSSWILFFLHYSNLLHSINKNYMFLVCNGILVFLARNSDFVGCSSSQFKDTTDILENADQINRENLQLEYHHQDFIQPEYSDMNYVLEEEEKELELELFIAPGHDHDEEEENDHEENGLLSGDELKKKCDDFIKKVKEQIRIEA